MCKSYFPWRFLQFLTQNKTNYYFDKFLIYIMLLSTNFSFMLYKYKKADA